MKTSDDKQPYERAVQGGPLARWRRITVGGVLSTALAFLGSPLLANHPCTSPLILDLENDGVLTASLTYSVEFDINGDSRLERIGWTAWYSAEAFLWIDLNGNHVVDDGRELFGDSMLLPTGEFAENGFDALAVYDLEEFGGNGDGAITSSDLIWRDLRLWIDRNHNGTSERPEISTLDHRRIAGISLDYVERNEYDGNLNLHKYQGEFLAEVSGPGGVFLRSQPVHDVFFVVEELAD